MSTLIHKEFKTFVIKQIKDHETMMVNKRRMEVSILPEFNQLFKKTEFYSSMSSVYPNMHRGERSIWQAFSSRQKEKVLGDRKRRHYGKCKQAYEGERHHGQESR